MDLTTDYYWLYLQIVILAAIIISEVARPIRRNLFAILVSGGILVLVSGQTWWLFAEFEKSGAYEINHLSQTISLPGALLANFYAGIGVFIYCISILLLGKRRPIVEDNVVARPNKKPNFLSYLFISLWVICMAGSLIVLAGGTVAMLTAPGLNMAYGVTMFLILLSLGKFPLIQKVVWNRAIRPIDVGLFFVVFIFTLFNSRILAAMILLQLVIVLNYCRREISRRTLLVVPILMFLIFIVFGLYRDFAGLSGGDIEQEAFYDFFTGKANETALLDWFYGVNVEGFVGLAGILTFDTSVGGIAHDFGLSNLTFLAQFIPGSLRNDPALPIKSLVEDVASLYPYSGSIIRPGLEVAYANFGLFGIIAFGILLAYLVNSLHVTMVQGKTDRIKVAVVSVQSLQLIRGTFTNVLFFALADLVMLFIYRFILKVCQGLRPVSVHTAGEAK